MNVLNQIQFRRLSLSWFVCFPKIYNITTSYANGAWFLQLWKNVSLVKINNRYGNSLHVTNRRSFSYPNGRFVQTRMDNGLISRIDLSFLGYNSIENAYLLNRNNLKLSSNQHYVNNFRQLVEYFSPIFKTSQLNSIQIGNYGKIMFKNKLGSVIQCNMRGTGIHSNVRNEICNSQIRNEVNSSFRF